MPMLSIQKQVGVFTTALLLGAEPIVPAWPLRSPNALAKNGPQACGGELAGEIGSRTHVKQNWSIWPVSGQKKWYVGLSWHCSGLLGSAALEGSYEPSCASVT